VTGGNQRTPSRPPGQPERFTIWALHRDVKKWLPLMSGLTGEEAVNEVWTRQDRLRRRDEPCRIITLPDGKTP
jgi:hypothetical protein